MNIVLTGATSGIGLATLKLLISKGHTVIATGRNIDNPTYQHDQVKWYALDIASEVSRNSFYETVTRDFPLIDGLINNAGYGLVSAFEGSSDQDIRDQFETNYFGTVALTQLFLPRFIAQKSGKILVVTSIGGRISFPFYGFYHGTKHALEGTFESLWFELQGTGVGVKIIEPGFTRTDFVSRSQRIGSIDVLRLKKPFDRLMKRLATSKEGSQPEEIASVIYSALSSKNSRLRYHGGYLSYILILRRILPEGIFRWMIGSSLSVKD